MIRINKSRCILCGVCEALSPSIFQQTGTGITVDTAEASRNRDDALLALEACPTACIEEMTP